jgi:hypothetical protein
MHLNADPTGEFPQGTSPKWKKVVIHSTLLLLVIAYGLQTLTPLRLNTDAVSYLSMASSAFDGFGFKHSQFPVGYPSIIVIMEWLSIATSFWLVSFNLIALSLGIFCFHCLLVRTFSLSKFESTTVCTITLLSWVMIKHLTIPLADIPYLGVSAFALMMMVTATRVRNRNYIAWSLILALLLCAIAISIRTIGIALLPAFAWAIFLMPATQRSIKRLLERFPRLPLWVASGVLVVILVGCYLIQKTIYFHYLVEAISKSGIWMMIGTNLGYRLMELGQIALNVPFSKLAKVEGVFWVMGAITLFFLANGFWRQIRKSSPLEIYMGVYLIILFAWPYYDPRYWIPVIPLLFGYTWKGVKNTRRFHNIPTLYSFLAAFFLTGIIALGYSTRITFAGDHFPERYGDGTLTNTYKLAFNQKFHNGQNHQTDKRTEEILGLLRRYGRNYP